MTEAAKCPVCGVTAEWHVHGTMPGEVWIDGAGEIPCEEYPMGAVISEVAAGVRRAYEDAADEDLSRGATMTHESADTYAEGKSLDLGASYYNLEEQSDGTWLVTFEEFTPFNRDDARQFILSGTDGAPAWKEIT